MIGPTTTACVGDKAALLSLESAEYVCRLLKILKRNSTNHCNLPDSCPLHNAIRGEGGQLSPLAGERYGYTIFQQ